jgi:hypothetical protein
MEVAGFDWTARRGRWTKPRRLVMRHVHSLRSVGALVGLLAICVIWLPVDAASRAGVLPADARALRYGPSAPDVVDNPALRDKVRALFGADWNLGGQLRTPASAFFPASSALRMVRIGDQDYIAISGCVPAACAANRGLLLIRPDGEHLMARIDEGGFSHYYDYRSGTPATQVPLPTIDRAWNAVEDIERG